jgi:hypothetical protein
VYILLSLSLKIINIIFFLISSMLIRRSVYSTSGRTGTLGINDHLSEIVRPGGWLDVDGVSEFAPKR